MNKFILFVAIASLACVAHAAHPQSAPAETLKHDSQLNADGSYKLDFATSNGISAQEEGHGGHHASGGYSYYSPEGELIQLSYLADENGFQPQGNHLPTPPPIPPQILKSLEYIRAHPYDENAARQQQSQRLQQQPQRLQQKPAFHHVAAPSHQVNSFRRPAQRRHF